MADDGESRVFRHAGISYLRVPARDPQTSAAFYRAVFGWTVDAARAEPSFEDGSGHVIGHLVADAVVAGEAGVRPYVYVENVDDTLRRVSEHGGALVDPPYPEGNLRVATFRDPAGNVIGVWQRRSERLNALLLPARPDRLRKGCIQPLPREPAAAQCASGGTPRSPCCRQAAADR